MSHPLEYSMFWEVLFPKASDNKNTDQKNDLNLQKIWTFKPEKIDRISQCSFVVFDFETTGLSSNRDEIIEIGAIKYQGKSIVSEFSELICPSIPLPEKISKITNISQEMLDGKRTISDALPDFLQFIEGSILVAHNAEFDISFLKAACDKNNVQISWPSICTLKMSRHILPSLPSHNLDTLASHFALTNEARHRSVGDCKVTLKIFENMMALESGSLSSLKDLKSFLVE